MQTYPVELNGTPDVAPVGNTPQRTPRTTPTWGPYLSMATMVGMSRLRTASNVMQALLDGHSYFAAGERYDSPFGRWVEARRSWLATGGYRLRMTSDPRDHPPGLLVWTERMPVVRRDGRRECPCCGSVVDRRTTPHRRLARAF